jgi:hypothetical protein
MAMAAMAVEEVAMSMDRGMADDFDSDDDMSGMEEEGGKSRGARRGSSSSEYSGSDSDDGAAFDDFDVGEDDLSTMSMPRGRHLR